MKTAERILIEEAEINFAKFPLDDYQKEMVLSAMRKYAEQFDISSSFPLAVEFGYKQCEKGNNLETALMELKKIVL